MSEIDRVIGRMDALLDPMVEARDENRYFLATYRRTTIAIKEEVERGGFQDPEWVERWDAVFADLYLDSLEAWTRGRQAPGPWAEAFDAARDPSIPPLRHVLLGINAHINYDLPQAFLAVVSDEEFDDAGLMRRRAADHERVDAVIVSRVDIEDRLLQDEEEPGDRTLLDRLLTPFNRAGTKRFLKEAREKVLHNAKELSRARRRGPEALDTRLKELEALSRARVADLRAPGQVILRLTIRGFGVLLPD